MPSSWYIIYQEPACCPSHRFAVVAGLEPLPQGDQSLRGHTAGSGRGLPTALPAGSRLLLVGGSRVGIRRYERD
jgi:hypothetical protein